MGDNLASTLQKPNFEDFGKIARLNRDCVITEKIDGTNAQIYIGLRAAEQPTIPPCIYLDDTFFIYAGSRNQWVNPLSDHFGLAKWVEKNAQELLKLGPGRHFGEWWGSGIRGSYGLKNGEKRFSLFNTHRWHGLNKPACCDVVPVLYSGLFSTMAVKDAMQKLRERGSVASPGFMRPEGVIVYHTAAGMYFKATLEKDEQPKSVAQQGQGPRA